MRRLVFRAEAVSEFAAAIDWLDARSPRAATEFIEAAESLLDRIRENPRHYQAIEDDIRHATMRNFPYMIIYFIEGDDTVVVSIFHTARDPQTWRNRVR